MKKVIYVPGFTGGRRDLQGFKAALKDEFEVLYFDYDTFLKDSLEENAGKLEKFIESLSWNDGEKGAIIGMSAGGVIADYYLKCLKNGRIDKFISLCTPFKGTCLAAIPTKRKGLKELRINHPFLCKLAEKKLENIDEENVYSPFDMVVIPGSSAKGVHPKVCYFPIHPLMEFWPEAIKEIKRFLEE